MEKVQVINMKLIKDDIITEQTDEFIISIFKDSGWQEVTEAPEVELKKEEPKMVDESDKKDQLQTKKRKNK